MIENSDKHKLKQLEKIYSPKRDSFKLASRTKNTENRSLYRRLLEVISGAKPASPAGGLLKLAQQEKTAQYSNTTNNWNIGKFFKRSLLTKNVFKKALALITIIAVIITTYLQFTPQTQAGTYTL